MNEEDKANETLRAEIERLMREYGRTPALQAMLALCEEKVTNDDG